MSAGNYRYLTSNDVAFGRDGDKKGINNIILDEFVTKKVPDSEIAELSHRIKNRLRDQNQLEIFKAFEVTVSNREAMLMNLHIFFLHVWYLLCERAQPPLLDLYNELRKLSGTPAAGPPLRPLNTIIKEEETIKQEGDE